MNRRVFARVVAGLGVAAAMFVGLGAGTGNATEASSNASIASAAQYLPNFGDSADFPTWFWGTTKLCAYNAGSGYGEAKVQSWSGADPEYLPLSPGETKCVDRWWFAVPVTVYNNAYSPLWVWTI
jgi:hypothetical protein